MDKLTDIYIADLISREKYEREYRELQAALSAASRVDERPIDVAQARAVLELYNQLDKPGKKEFWSRTIKSITAHPDSLFSFTLRQL